MKKSCKLNAFIFFRQFLELLTFEIFNFQLNFNFVTLFLMIQNFICFKLKKKSITKKKLEF